MAPCLSLLRMYMLKRPRNYYYDNNTNGTWITGPYVNGYVFENNHGNI